MEKQAYLTEYLSRLVKKPKLPAATTPKQYVEAASSSGTQSPENKNDSSYNRQSRNP